MKKLYPLLCLAVFYLFTTTAVSAQTSPLILPENFEGSSFPTGWTQASSPPVEITASNACAGSQSARMLVNSVNQNPRLQSPVKTTSGSAIAVSFKYKIINQTGGGATPTTFGTLELQYSVDANVPTPTWTTYAQIDGTNHTPSTNCTTHTATIPAASVPAGSNFSWRIRAVWGTGSYYVYIDDFLAVEQVSCIQPIYIKVSDITFDQAKIAWTDLAGATSWEIEYGPQYFPPGLGFGTIVTANTNPFVLTGLMDGELYDVYVRAVCSPTDKSEYTGPITFQTIAIGTDCNTPKEITALPYNHSADTQTYGNSYTGSPGNGCIGNDYLQGYDVVYKYTPPADDYLNIKLSALVGEDRVGVFIYQSCAGIGTSCYAGATTSDGSDINFDVFVTGGQTYYIVISTAGANTTTQYTLDIKGFDCATFGAPDGLNNYEFFGQTLAAFNNTRIGVKPTNDFADLVWYQDNAGVPGAVIPNPASVNLTNGAVYHVNQELGTCQSAFLTVTFTEFDCLGQLAILTTDSGAEICEEGTTTLSATANTTNIFWFATQTGGEPLAAGPTYTTDVIDQTTSYWVSEAFIGEGNLGGQANPGPSTVSTSTSNNYGVIIDNITSDFILVDVQVFSTAGGGTTTVKLVDISGATPDQTTTVSLPAGSTAVPKPYTIPLDFELKSGKQYRLLKETGPAMIYATSATSSFPYDVGTVAQVTSGSSSSSTSSNYYYFFNWTITEEQPLCESPRTEVIAKVNEVFDVVPTATSATVCVNQAADLSVTSTDTDYVYTWSWTDATGTTQTQTGANIQPLIVQNTTFTVKGYNPITGCTSDEESINIEAIGAGDIPVTPQQIDVCVGEIVKLTAGGVYNTFEEANPGWTITNNSTGPLNPAGAGWKIATSPYNPANGASSNDNSKFYIATSDAIGPGGTLDTQLTSPPFNLVGVQNASLTFYHYYRHSQVQYTQAKVQISVNNGNWVDLTSFGANNSNCSTCDKGSSSNFEFVDLDLSNYTGAAHVRVRFNYTGKWGWWWAIDNVTISRDYTNGQVTWVSTNDLFLDELATIPYNGTSTNQVYFKSDIPGTFNYQVELDIVGCSQPVTTPVTITVSETMPPTGPAVQDYITGETLSKLNVTGQNLRYYIKENGQMIQVSPNFLIKHGVTYYITQTENGCESDYLEVTANLVCPSPTDVAVSAEVGTTGTAAAVIVTWTLPSNTRSIQKYFIEITDSSGASVFTTTVKATENYRVIQGLAFDETFELTLYSICDENVPVYSSIETVTFDTNGLGTDRNNFDGFTYHPNPTNDIVTFTNSQPINSIEVYSATGQRVLELRNINGPKAVVDFSALKTGVYFSMVKVGETVEIVRIIRK